MNTIINILDWNNTYDASKVSIDAIDMASRDIERYGDFLDRKDFAGKWLTMLTYLYEGEKVSFFKVRGRTIDIKRSFSESEVKKIVSNYKNSGDHFSKDTRGKNKKVSSYASGALSKLMTK